MSKKDSADSAITKRYHVRKDQQHCEDDETFRHNETEAHRTWNVASQAGGETNARHPISSLLFAKIIFSKQQC